MDNGDTFSVNCENTVYFKNVSDGQWYSVGTVVNSPTYGGTAVSVGSSYPPNLYHYDVPIVVQIGSCSGGAKPGTTSPMVSSLDWSVELGKGDFGNSSGKLRIISDTARAALSTPLLLSASAPSSAFDLRLDSQHAIRQVLSPTGLVQVSNDTEDGSQHLYKIDFLTRPSPLVDTNGFYLTNGSTLIKEITVQNPNGSTNYNTLWITEIEGSSSNQTQYVYDPTNLLWTLTRAGNLSRVTLQTVSSNATELLTRKSIFKPGTPDQLVYREEKTYTNVTYVVGGVTNLTGFTYLVKEVIDPDGAQLTTTHDYYWDPTETNRFRKAKQHVKPDGSWERFDY